MPHEIAVRTDGARRVELLLVDDDAEVRRLWSSFLERSGFSVFLADSGEARDRLGPVLRAEGLALDTAARTVTVRGTAVVLTRKEFDLLAVFMERPRRVLTQRFLLEAVWGCDLADDNDTHTVTSHLYSLRRKLGPELGRRIVTVAGTGYRFDPAPVRSPGGI